jgi:hypothetical protein
MDLYLQMAEAHQWTRTTAAFRPVARLGQGCLPALGQGGGEAQVSGRVARGDADCRIQQESVVIHGCFLPPSFAPPTAKLSVCYHRMEIMISVMKIYTL